MLNPISQLNHRIDLVFYRGDFGVRDILLLGNTGRPDTKRALAIRSRGRADDAAHRKLMRVRFRWRISDIQALAR